MKKYLKNFRPALLFFCVFVVFTLLVVVVDVKEAGVNGTKLGFAGLNKALTPRYNGIFYVFSEFFGIISLLIAAGFAVIGIIQLVKRKSLLKVDHRILALGAVYVLMLVLYLIFAHIPINYRPVLNGEEMEISYPSSHTMLALTVLLTALIYTGSVIKDKKVSKWVSVVLFSLIGLSVFTRFFSGVHWFTDIIGGTLLALSLATLYSGGVKTVSQIKKEKKRAKEALNEQN